MTRRERRVLEESAAALERGETRLPLTNLLLLLSGKPGVPPVKRRLISDRLMKSRGRTCVQKRRVVSYRKSKELAEYHAAHPSCEVCERPAMPTPHHLYQRSLGGQDVEDNLISLCFFHHIGDEGFHTLGMFRWFERVREYLAPDALRKVEQRLAQSGPYESQAV